jgi:hypothetical protein
MNMPFAAIGSSSPRIALMAIVPPAPIRLISNILETPMVRWAGRRWLAAELIWEKVTQLSSIACRGAAQLPAEHRYRVIRVRRRLIQFTLNW